MYYCLKVYLLPRYMLNSGEGGVLKNIFFLKQKIAEAEMRWEIATVNILLPVNAYH